MSDVTELTPGFFGKLPALGDFVQRQLPGAFVKVWDGWLQASIASSKSHLGEHWLEVYLHSPVWRFTLFPGIGGSQGWSGVMIPSVDRVGRYFPLTLAAPVPEGTASFSMIKAHDWFDRAETILLSALEEKGFSIDDFTQAVANLGPCAEAGEAYNFDQDVSSMRSGWQIELGAVDRADDALGSVAEMLAKQRFGSFSLWWTGGSELIRPSLLVSPDLPKPESYTAMLDGRWRESSWQSFGSADSVNVADSLQEIIDA